MFLHTQPVLYPKARASVLLDPMISRLGIPTEDVPIKVRLRNGSASEQQTLVLKMPARLTTNGT